mgnify:CR=1 FL=1
MTYHLDIGGNLLIALIIICICRLFGQMVPRRRIQDEKRSSTVEIKSNKSSAVSRMQGALPVEVLRNFASPVATIKLPQPAMGGDRAGAWHFVGSVRHLF